MTQTPEGVISSRLERDGRAKRRSTAHPLGACRDDPARRRWRGMRSQPWSHDAIAGAPGDAEREDQELRADEERGDEERGDEETGRGGERRRGERRRRETRRRGERRRGERRRGERRRG
ncbi:unnamed protein product [Arctogadus glacialis]